MTNKEYFYSGNSYSLEPGSDSVYTGAKIGAGTIGATTSIQTANQVTEVTNLLNSGMKPVEISILQPEIFDMIPKQHLKEINRLSKLTGAEPTLHAPLLEPSGFTEQGWSEQNRELMERQLSDTVNRASDINPNGQMPVTIHASSVGGVEHMPAKLLKDLTDEEKERYGANGLIPTRMIAVNQQTGEMMPLRREKRYYPNKPEGKIYSPEEEIDIANSSYWDNKLSQLIFYKERGDELLSKNYLMIAPEYKKLATGEMTEKAFENLISSNPEKKAAFNNLKNASLYLENTQQNLNSLYNEAYKLANDDAKKALLNASNKFEQGLRNSKDISHYSEALQNVINAMHTITVDRSGKGLTPQVYKPVEEFITDKASETFSNVAYNAYKKFGDKAPIISIENPPYGMAMGDANNLKNLIEESRKKFVVTATKKGMSEEEAKRASKQMIGATWDTSHISMMRKQGFDKGELIEQAKTIAPFVKHVHLNDNFGFSHTDLPPGMGDVPFDKITAELKKAGFKGKNIVEGGNFFQHFKTSPHTIALEAMGSPIYGAVAQPTWANSYGIMGVYSSGYGPFLPEHHFSMYGAGFSTLPQDLGGQMPGGQSRLSGTPMS